MEEPIVIELFRKIFKPLIKLMGYILCIPQLMLKDLKLKIVENYCCNNIFQILYTTIFLFFYNFIYLNFHLIYFLKIFSAVESKFELFIAFVIFYTFTASFYYAEDIRFFILKDLGFLFVLTKSILEYIFVVLSFFVRLDNRSFELIFSNNLNLGISWHNNFSIVNIFYYFFETVYIVFLNLLIILHAVNPLSLFRVPFLLHIRDFDNQSISVIASFIFIIADFLLLGVHLLNIPFIFSFVKTTIKIFSSAFTNVNSLNYAFAHVNNSGINPIFNNFMSGQGCRKYNYNANLILDSFLTNYGFIISFINKYIKPIIFSGKVLKFIKMILKYSIVLVFSGFNLIFAWRIKQLLKNQSKFKQESYLWNFISQSMQLNWSGITDLLFVIVFFLNKINIFTYFFLGLFEKNLIQFSRRNLDKKFYEKEKINKFLEEITEKDALSIFNLFKKNKILDVFLSEKFYMIKILNFQVFFAKNLDLIISLISIINVFSPTFYIKLYNYLKYKKNLNSDSTIQKKESTVNSIAINYISNFYLFPLLSVEYNEKLQARFQNDLDNSSMDKIFKLKNMNYFIENYVTNCNYPIIELARKIVLKNISKDLLFGILITLNMFTVIDPFSGLMHIFNIFKFLGRIKMSFSKFNEININNKTNKESVYHKISNIIDEEIKVSLKVLYESILNIIIRLPLILVSVILFPFNLLRALLFCFENNYLYFYKKIRKNNQFSLRENLNTDQKAYVNYNKFLVEADEEINNLINFKKNRFIKSVFTQFIKGWTTIIKFVLIHLSVIRAIYMYYDLFSLKKFYNFFKNFITKINKTEQFLAYINFMNKQNDNKSIYEEETVKNSEDNDKDNINYKQNPNSFVDDNYSNINLLRLLNSSKKYFSKKNIFIFYDKESWTMIFNDYFYEKNLVQTNKKSSISEIDIDSLKKLISEKITFWAYFEGIIDDNFHQLIKEIIFYPIVLLAFASNPIVFYFGFIALKSNDYNIFRQRKFNLKFKICLFICNEYLKIVLNILKILFIAITIVKIPDLLMISYYYSRTLFSKNPDCYFKFLLDEHYEGEFSKDLNTLVLQTINFYFIMTLILLNFILILRIPSVVRRVGRFAKAYIKNFKFKYFGKKLSKREKASPLESTKINSFASICEYFKPKELGKMLILSKSISKRAEKKLIWNNLFVNYYLKKIKKFLKYLELKEKNDRLTFLEKELQDLYAYPVSEEGETERKNYLNKTEAEKAELADTFNNKEFALLSAKFQDKNLPIESLKIIVKEYETKQFEGKTLCQKAQNSFDFDQIIPEKLRDKFLGLTNVLVEETFESIFKCPHLILLPFKLISIPLILIADAHVWFYLATFGRLNAEESRQNQQKLYDEIMAGNVFYNIQLYGLFSLIKILSVQITVVLIILDSLYKFVLRALSLNWLLKTKVSFGYNYDGCLEIKRFESIHDQYGHLGWNDLDVETLTLKEIIYVFVGHLITLLVLLMHVFIALFPTIYFKCEGISNIFHKAFFDDHRLENHSISRAGGSPFLSGLNWYILFEEIFNTFWKMSLSNMFYLIVGNYFLNIVSFIITFSIYVHYSIEFRLKLDKFSYYSVIIVWLEIIMRCILSFEFIYSIIYPNIFLFKIYKFFARRFRILNNKIMFNLVSLIVVIYPFYLNFKFKFSLLRFAIINIWAITSFMRLGKITGSLN